MGYTDGSCCGNKVSHGVLPTRTSEGEIKERREGSLDERGVRVAVSPKEERREGEGGSGMGTRAWGREPTGGEAHSA